MQYTALNSRLRRAGNQCSVYIVVVKVNYTELVVCVVYNCCCRWQSATKVMVIEYEQRKNLNKMPQIFNKREWKWFDVIFELNPVCFMCNYEQKN